MIHNSSNTMIDRITRVGLATPALALTILAGAAFAQQGAVGRAYEVIVEAEAQDKADAPRARVATGQDGRNSRVVIEIHREIDGKTVVVRRINDEPIIVKINGKVLSKDHYEFKDGAVVISEPGTGHTYTFRIPPQAIVPASAGGIGRVELAVPMHLGTNSGGTRTLAQMADAPQPKVMLGVVMAEPDATILEHLGLDSKKAVLLERVVDGLPAQKAGLRDQDIIIGFGKKAEPRSADEIRKILANAQPGSVVKVKVIRKGHPVTVELKFEAFNAQALGRAIAPQTPGDVRVRSSQDGQNWGPFDHEREAKQSRLEHARRAMKEAADMLARMEGEIDRSAVHAHAQASEAIERAIRAMREGEAFGIEIEDMRRMQQEAVERLRGDMAQNQNDQRFWAEHGEPGEGFALRFPGQNNNQARWAERFEHLEARLNNLEHSVERTMERIESRSEAMIERLMERFEQALDNREGGR